jgi:hypothetical protein
MIFEFKIRKFLMIGLVRDQDLEDKTVFRVIFDETLIELVLGSVLEEEFETDNNFEPYQFGHRIFSECKEIRKFPLNEVCSPGR